MAPALGLIEREAEGPEKSRTDILALQPSAALNNIEVS